MQSENSKKLDPILLIDCTEEEIENFNKKYDELILEPYRHVDETKGKNARTQLCHLFNYWFELPQDQIDIIYDVLTKLHNLLLLIDDIQDSSYLRRSKPAAHVIYGSARTFTSANCLDYAKNVPRIHLNAVRQLIRKWVTYGVKGQIMETYWRDNFICPTEEQYVDMVNKKIGGYFMYIVELLQVFSGKYVANFFPLCDVMSLYFQIMDDYCNLKSAEYHKKKGFCDDISDGKFSFPVIYAVHNNPESHRIKDILRMNTKDHELKKECLQLIENNGGFAYTEKKLKSVREKMFEEIDKLGGNKIRKYIFTDVSGYQDKDLFEALMQEFDVQP